MNHTGTQKNATFGEDEIVDVYHASRMEWPGSASYHHALNQHMLDHLPENRHLTVLDDMCGTGVMMPALKDRYHTIVGVDLSRKVLNYAVRYENKLTQGDSTYLPFKDSGFDIVVVRGGLHHIPQMELALSEVARVLKPGGTCVFLEPREDNLLVHIIRRFIYHVNKAFNPEEEHGLKTSDFEAMIAKAQLKVIHQERFGLLGFALYANPDSLDFTRPFSFMPGAARLARWFMRLDSLMNKLPLLNSFALETFLVAQKQG